MTHDHERTVDADYLFGVVNKLCNIADELDAANREKSRIYKAARSLGVSTPVFKSLLARGSKTLTTDDLINAVRLPTRVTSPEVVRVRPAPKEYEGQDTGSFIYVAVTADRRFLKVGISKNPQQRLRGLESAQAQRLHLWLTFPGTRQVELGLHEALRPHQVKGEWYAYSDALNQQIRLLTGFQGQLS